MRIYEDGQFDKNNGCALALGSFDALHIAHTKLIKKTIECAQGYGVRSGVHMFFERIENVIFPNTTNKSIYTNEQRIEIIEHLGADFLYFENFDVDFMNMSAYDFAKMLKEKFAVVCVVVGFDYTFGRGGEGNAQLLKEYGKAFGFDVVIMDAYKICDEIVSSTNVREFIKNGNIEKANELLGRKYCLCGEIIHDRGVGHKLGVPTANINFENSVILPKNGVYAGFVELCGQKYTCVVNIGIRPTFSLDKMSVEVHIIDFDDDLYGEKMCVYLIKRLRQEKNFDTDDALVEQILEDIDIAKDLFLHDKTEKIK